MIDSRITGATIARLRRAQDWTQLARLSEIFKVSVDALLKDDLSPTPVSSGRATTGDVLIELAQGNAEQVARRIVADQANHESVIEAAPLTRPSIIEAVVQKNMNGYSFAQVQIAELAPFVDQELLASLVEGLDPESLQPTALVELAPFLGADQLGRLIDHFGDLPISADLLVELAPFL